MIALFRDKLGAFTVEGIVSIEIYEARLEEVQAA